ncbi:EFR1 family ferrodoxin [Myxococcota bacterium]|nr:EFR1 family ferrodoxin [Myxococcota bacterium]MBU1432494.1 EFR1 family ferrodoxin [Myxococcota bacterium]MBU1896350.1 EFR1 family ferrodoxin [Myxococcota bacterium]
MKIDLYVMSGTGNTLRAARWCREVAEAAHGPDTLALHPIADGAALPTPGEVSAVGIMGPTHGFTAPWSVLRFAARLPRGQGRPAFTLFTRAGLVVGRWHPPGLAGTAALLIALIMALKGYRVVGVMSVNMPSNWMMIHPALRLEAAEAVRAHAEPKVKAFAARLLRGAPTLWTLNNLYELSLGLPLLPISLLYLFCGRFWLAKLLFANMDCTRCGLCAKSCPSLAIEMRDGRPFWRFSCESCMRCLAYCPHQAIEAGHSWAALTYTLWALPLGWAGWRLWSSAHPWTAALLEMAWMFALLAPLYAAFHWGLKRRWLNRAFTYTTLTRWFRKAHDPQVRLSALLMRRGRGR